MTHAEIGESLLAAILDDPTDDARRLIYADWLEDEGQDDRAEFVRLQLQVAALGLCDCLTPKCEYRSAGAAGMSKLARCGTCVFCKPMRRVEELHTHFACDIVGEMPFSYAYTCQHRSQDWDATLSNHFTFYLWRGFVDTVRCPLQAWLDHGPAIATRHPVARIETERRPYVGIGAYWWFRGNSRNEHELPEEVFVALTGQDATAGAVVNTFRGSESEGWPSGKGYDSAADALDALSDALLALARSQVVPARAETVS